MFKQRNLFFMTGEKERTPGKDEPTSHAHFNRKHIPFFPLPNISSTKPMDLMPQYFSLL